MDEIVGLPINMEIRNLYAYSKERFPVVNMALFAILFTTVMCIATYSNGTAVKFGFNEIIGCLAVISFFFRLRVFDEIKDYDVDVINHPQRVLQTGRITTKDLWSVSVGLGLIEIVWSFLNGTETLVAWSCALVFAVLMRYEFFSGKFLKQYLFIYAVSHMMVMPLVIYWVWSAYTEMSFSYNLLLLCSLSVVSGFAFEIARKIKLDADEKDSVDSYSKIVGYANAVFLVLLILLIGVLDQFALLKSLNARLWPFILIGALYVSIVVLYVSALVSPRREKLKFSELMVSLFMLFSYVSIIIEIFLPGK
jgi:4-hydroxybenzoate polyprenyltransferase